MPLLKRIETLDDHHRSDITYVNPEYVIKLYQTPMTDSREMGSIIFLAAAGQSKVSKLLSLAPLPKLLSDLGPFVPVYRDNREKVEYVRVQAIVAVTMHDYYKPVHERTEGWLHLKDGTSMIVSDRAGILKKIEALA